MPWVSKAQARWGHSSAGVEALGKEGVREWDAATKKGSLPDKKKPHWPGALKNGNRR